MVLQREHANPVWGWADSGEEVAVVSHDELGELARAFNRMSAELAARVDELIELFGLEAFRHKQVRELSTGSRRIVDLACVVAHKPSVVLLDEPSSGIAQRETEALGPLLLRLRDELHCSLVLIEHDMPLVRSVSERLLALDSGALVVEGEPEMVLRDARVVGGDHLLGPALEHVAACDVEDLVLAHLPRRFVVRRSADRWRRMFRSRWIPCFQWGFCIIAGTRSTT